MFATLTVKDNGVGQTPALPAYVAKTPEAFSYDYDGNLTSDGRWNYTYDAENRLITMETIPAAVTAGVTRQLLTFTYDYLGRRVSKVVQSGWTGSTYANTDLSRRFIYNGWNLIAETNHVSSDAIVRNYFWGLDLSGPGQGAGGVGALLMIQDGSGISYAPIYNALGTIYALVNGSSVTLSSTTYPIGSLVAVYEYDAFGKALWEAGPYATLSPFQFSTKYADLETGLIYYGMRYYSPSMGRFVNRDPNEEAGGVNLYGFCANNSANGWDVLGMDPAGTNYGLWRDDESNWTEEQRDKNMSLNLQYGCGGHQGPCLGNISGGLLDEIPGANDWVTTRSQEFNAVADMAGIPTDFHQSANGGGYTTADGGNYVAKPDSDGIYSSIGNAPNSTDFQVTGRPSQFGTGQLLKPGMVPALDGMIKNDNFVNQLGVLYGLNQKYGIQQNGGSVDVTEFFATLNGSSASSTTLYSNTITLSSGDFNSGGWTASVSPSFTTGDLLAVSHTHPINGVPSDGHDFAWQQPALSSRNLWSVVVTPTNIYFTGPQQGQYYYLPTSTFTSAGQANNKTVTIPSMPGHGP